MLLQRAIRFYRSSRGGSGKEDGLREAAPAVALMAAEAAVAAKVSSASCNMWTEGGSQVSFPSTAAQEAREAAAGLVDRLLQQDDEELAAQLQSPPR